MFAHILDRDGASTNDVVVLKYFNDMSERDLGSDSWCGNHRSLAVLTRFPFSSIRFSVESLGRRWNPLLSPRKYYRGRRTHHRLILRGAAFQLRLHPALVGLALGGVLGQRLSGLDAPLFKDQHR